MCYFQVLFIFLYKTFENKKVSQNKIKNKVMKNSFKFKGIK